MRRTRPKHRLASPLRPLLWTLLAAALAPVPVSAGPWMQKRGHGIVIFGWHDYRASESFSVTGGRQPLAAGGVFQSRSLHFWAEAGLTNRWTGILSGSIPSLRYSDAGYRASSLSVGDLQAGLRRGLRNPDSGWQVAAQMLLKAPAYSSRVEPRPGNGQADLEGSLLAGRSFPAGNRWGFVSLEGGYRKRWGQPSDQLRGEAAAGIHWNQRLTFMGQTFAIRRIGALPDSAVVWNPLVVPTFDLYKFQASAVIRLSPDWRVQAGFGTDFAGRNIGRGRQWMVAVWKTF
jgi:hypothetical protein